MEKTNEKKILVLSFLGVITLIAVVVGATFAPILLLKVVEQVT